MTSDFWGKDQAKQLVKEECRLEGNNLRLVYLVKIGDKKEHGSMSVDIDLDSIKAASVTKPPFTGPNNNSVVTLSFDRAVVTFDAYSGDFRP